MTLPEVPRCEVCGHELRLVISLAGSTHGTVWIHYDDTPRGPGCPEITRAP